MPFLAPTLENADPLFALVITSAFYLNHVGVAEQDPASGSLVANIKSKRQNAKLSWINNANSTP